MGNNKKDYLGWRMNSPPFYYQVTNNSLEEKEREHYRGEKKQRIEYANTENNEN